MDYNPKTDLSPAFIGKFTFFVFFSFWLMFTIWVFVADGTISEPVFDETTGELISSREDFERYILMGKREHMSTGMKFFISAFWAVFLIGWAIRIQWEMWIFRRVTKGTRRWIDGG